MSLNQISAPSFLVFRELFLFRTPPPTLHPRSSPFSLHSFLGVVLVALGGLAQHPADAQFRGVLRTEQLSEAIRACGGLGPGPDRHCAPLFPLPIPLPLSGLGKASSIATLFLFFQPCCDRICPKRSVPSQLSGPILMKVTECPGS